MPQLRYGGKQGQVIQYEVDPDLVVVRMRSKQSFRSGPVPRPEAALLEEMELVAEFPDTGVEVYRKRPGVRLSVRTVREELKKAPDTRFAGRVLVEVQSKEPVVYTENLFVKFRDEEDREDCMVVLHNRQGGRTVNLRRGYDTAVAPGLAAYAGKSAQETWQLEVRDEARIDTGLIRKFGLELRIASGEPRRVEKKPVRKRRK